MLKSIIEEIYFDNQGYMEKIKPTEEYYKLCDECCELLDKLKETLNDGEKQDLEKLYDTHVGMCAESELKHFKEGLKIGLLLGLECLS